jgi:WD40 repeat protein
MLHDSCEGCCDARDGLQISEANWVRIPELVMMRHSALGSMRDGQCSFDSNLGGLHQHSTDASVLLLTHHMQGDRLLVHSGAGGHSLYPAHAPHKGPLAHYPYSGQGNITNNRHKWWVDDFHGLNVLLQSGCLQQSNLNNCCGGSPLHTNLKQTFAPTYLGLSVAAVCRFVRTAFSPDGSHFVTGSVDGAAYVWEVRVTWCCNAKFAFESSKALEACQRSTNWPVFSLTS